MTLYLCTDSKVELYALAFTQYPVPSTRTLSYIRKETVFGGVGKEWEWFSGKKSCRSGSGSFGLVELVERRGQVDRRRHHLELRVLVGVSFAFAFFGAGAAASAAAAPSAPGSDSLRFERRVILSARVSRGFSAERAGRAHLRPEIRALR